MQQPQIIKLAEEMARIYASQLRRGETTTVVFLSQHHLEQWLSAENGDTVGTPLVLLAASKFDTLSLPEWATVALAVLGQESSQLDYVGHVRVTK
jgi:hypothetical protein